MQREPWWMRNLVFVMFGVIASITTPVIWYAHTHPEPPPPCERFANWAMKDVPARCVRYFQEQR